MANKMQIDVLRYHPDRDEQPWKQSFTIDWTPDMSILDALQVIKDDFEPELAYRWSCRMEVCGSCGMVVNGVPKLACSTFLKDYAKEGHITIAPLDQMPIEKDLVVDMNPFIEKLESVKPYIVNPQPKPVADGEYLQTPAQLAKFKQYTQCINCLLCYQACPQVGINAEFLGPAVTALAHRYNLDSRDHASSERRERMNDENGLWPCTFVGYCSEVCPKHVDPAGAIQQEKASSVPIWAKSLLGKKGA